MDFVECLKWWHRQRHSSDPACNWHNYSLSRCCSCKWSSWGLGICLRHRNFDSCWCACSRCNYNSDKCLVDMGCSCIVYPCCHRLQGGALFVHRYNLWCVFSACCIPGWRVVHRQHTSVWFCLRIQGDSFVVSEPRIDIACSCGWCSCTSDGACCNAR